MQRELIIRIEGTGVDNDAGTILVYRLGDQISLVATVEKDGDAEVILSHSETSRLVTALQGMLPCRPARA